MLAYVRTKNVTESDMVSYQLREKVKWKRVKISCESVQKTNRQMIEAKNL